MENTNKIEIIGTINGKFTHSHNNYGENFYTTSITTKRSSGVSDILIIQCSDRDVDITQDLTNTLVKISGNIRSFNNKSENKTKLEIYVLVDELKIIKEPDIFDSNNVNLCGYIVKKQPYRETPLGRSITDFILAVNRNFNRSSYIPCITWGKNAKYLDKLPVGTELEVFGRLQSRNYEKDNTTHTVYELSVQSITEV